MSHKIYAEIKVRLRLAVMMGLFLSSPLASSGAQIHAVALFKDKAVLDIDGKRRSASVGSTTREGVKLLQANSERAVIEIEGEKPT